jgi:hypothetical protein
MFHDIILTLRISRKIDEVVSLQQWYDQHAFWYIDDLSQIYSHSTGNYNCMSFQSNTWSQETKYHDHNIHIDYSMLEGSFLFSPSASNRLNRTMNYIILTLRISRKIDEVVSLQQWYDQHAFWYIDDLSQIYSHSTIIPQHQ